MPHERRPDIDVGYPQIFLYKDVEIAFNERECLPPDQISVEMGIEAARVVEFLRLKQGDPHLPIRILELGIGSGVCEVALLSKVHNPNEIRLTGVDIDQRAIDTARFNIRRTFDNQDITRLFQADWYDPNLWEYLSETQHDIILFNPPYLSEGTAIRQSYEQAPLHALFAPGDGLEHYRKVLPKLFTVLCSQVGSTLIVRMPSVVNDPTNQMARRHNEVLDNAMASQSDKQMMRFTRIIAPVGDRNNSTVTFTRGSGLNHLDGMLDVAMRAGLTIWPDTPEAKDQAIVLSSQVPPVQPDATVL